MTATITHATLAGRSQRLRGIALSCRVVSTVTTPHYTISSHAAVYITTASLPARREPSLDEATTRRATAALPPDHPHQILAQCIEVRLFSELCGEALEGLSRIILLAVEA